MDQNLFQIILGCAAFFGAFYVKSIKEDIMELKKQDQHIHDKISDVRESFVRKDDLSKLLEVQITPVVQAITELRQDLKMKKDKE